MLNEVTNDDNDKTEQIISSIQNTMTDTCKCPTELKVNKKVSEMKTQIQLTQTDTDTEEEKEETKPIMNEFI